MGWHESCLFTYKRQSQLKGRNIVKASDLFVKCLEEEEVEYIFGVPGEENAKDVFTLPFFDTAQLND